jgi:hypothetical protein
VHIARVGEQVGRAPQEPHAGVVLAALEEFGDLVEVAVALGERPAFGCGVAVVEALELQSELGAELEARGGALAGGLHGIVRLVPGQLAGG